MSCVLDENVKRAFVIKNVIAQFVILYQIVVKNDLSAKQTGALQRRKKPCAILTQEYSVHMRTK